MQLASSVYGSAGLAAIANRMGLPVRVICRQGLWPASVGPQLLLQNRRPGTSPQAAPVPGPPQSAETQPLCLPVRRRSAVFFVVFSSASRSQWSVSLPDRKPRLIYSQRANRLVGPIACNVAPQRVGCQALLLAKRNNQPTSRPARKLVDAR